MIRPSPEVLAVANRWYKTIVDGDLEGLKHFMSTSDYLRFIGTSEGEYWNGQAVRDGIGAHYGEIPRAVRFEIDQAEAYESGDVGWCCFANTFWFANRPDTPIHFRATLIFVLENGMWKLIHRHASVPTPNTDIAGSEHSAIQALADAAQQGFALNQRDGLASVMFTDIVGSSQLASALGDRIWTPIVTEHFAMIRAQVEQQGGQFVKSLGDGTMSSFPSARSALRAARDIQQQVATRTSEPQIGVRIGLHTGEIVQSDDDFFGTVVNKAARITATADAGEIRVSDVTRLMVGSDAELIFSDGAPVHLKGFEGPHVVHHLNWRI